MRSPGFWSSYLLDIVGPAWIYILMRGLVSRTQPAMLGRFLNPEAALVISVGACFLIAWWFVRGALELRLAGTSDVVFDADPVTLDDQTSLSVFVIGNVADGSFSIVSATDASPDLRTQIEEGLEDLEEEIEEFFEDDE